MSTANISLALELLVQLAVQSQRISVLLQQAQAEKRDLSVNELDAIISDATDSRAQLVLAIQRARSGG